MSHDLIDAYFVGSCGIHPAAEGMSAFMRDMFHLKLLHDTGPGLSELVIAEGMAVLFKQILS